MRLPRSPLWVMALALPLSACSAPADAANRLVEGGATGSVDLAAVFPTSWDRVYVLGPYETGETIEATICMPWADAERAAEYVKSDAYYLLVFAEGRAVTAWYTLNHGPDQPYVAFKPDTPLAFAREQARFTLEQSELGSYLLTPLLVGGAVPSCS